MNSQDDGLPSPMGLSSPGQMKVYIVRTNENETNKGNIEITIQPRDHTDPSRREVSINFLRPGEERRVTSGSEVQTSERQGNSVDNNNSIKVEGVGDNISEKGIEEPELKGMQEGLPEEFGGQGEAAPEGRWKAQGDPRKDPTEIKVCLPENSSFFKYLDRALAKQLMIDSFQNETVRPESLKSRESTGTHDKKTNTGNYISDESERKTNSVTNRYFNESDELYSESEKKSAKNSHRARAYLPCPNRYTKYRKELVKPPARYVPHRMTKSRGTKRMQVRDSGANGKGEQPHQLRKETKPCHNVLEAFSALIENNVSRREKECQKTSEEDNSTASLQSGKLNDCIMSGIVGDGKNLVEQRPITTDGCKDGGKGLYHPKDGRHLKELPGWLQDGRSQYSIGRSGKTPRDKPELLHIGDVPSTKGKKTDGTNAHKSARKIKDMSKDNESCKRNYSEAYVRRCEEERHCEEDRRWSKTTTACRCCEDHVNSQFFGCFGPKNKVRPDGLCYYCMEHARNPKFCTTCEFLFSRNRCLNCNDILIPESNRTGDSCRRGVNLSSRRHTDCSKYSCNMCPIATHKAKPDLPEQPKNIFHCRCCKFKSDSKGEPLKEEVICARDAVIRSKRYSSSMECLPNAFHGSIGSIRKEEKPHVLWGAYNDHVSSEDAEEYFENYNDHSLEDS